MYQVEPTDTLASVAAHFDITPSELAILNRLPSRNVFPGQVIRVPDRRRHDDPGSDDKENKHDNPSEPSADDSSQACDDEMGESPLGSLKYRYIDNFFVCKIQNVSEG